MLRIGDGVEFQLIQVDPHFFERCAAPREAASVLKTVLFRTKTRSANIKGLRVR